jgi:hypothetical protein
MKESVTFLDCPAFMDADGGLRCCLPAPVRCRYIMNSTGGPLEGAVISCPAGHRFNGPIEFLTLEKHLPGPMAPRGSRHGQRLPGPEAPTAAPGSKRKVASAARQSPTRDLHRSGR